ncbi:unnamed protein product [Acidithrix sp. C25]|nr:unnamed protein product [Acidithrix sp. C25]
MGILAKLALAQEFRAVLRRMKPSLKTRLIIDLVKNHHGI